MGADFLSRLFETIDTGLSKELEESAKSGQLGSFEALVRQARNEDKMIVSLSCLLEDMIQNPVAYRGKQEIIQILAKNFFDFSEFFGGRPISEGTVDHGLWTMFAKDPQQETAQAAALLLADALKNYYAKDIPYQIPFSTLFADTEAPSLIGADAARKIKESIMVTQNALVELVSTQGSKLPLNRGPAFLKFIEDQDKTGLWTRKFTDIQTCTKYSVTAGDMPSFFPAF